VGALLAGLLLAAPAPAPPRDSLRVAELTQACVEGEDEEGVAACRRAIDHGMTPSRTAVLYQLLALKLASLERWGEVAEAYRALGELRPDDAETQLRLARVLLYGLDEPAEAADAAREAARLDPAHAEAFALLGAALNELDRHTEAVAAFEEALRLEPAFLDERPAARAVYQAARRGESWP
jgi:tetratricopeptide (TPR) repeat protein